MDKRTLSFASFSFSLLGLLTIFGVILLQEQFRIFTPDYVAPFGVIFIIIGFISGLFSFKFTLGKVGVVVGVIGIVSVLVILSILSVFFAI